MRKFAFFCLALFSVLQVSAQTCVRDSSLIGTDTIVSPKPWTTEDPTIYTAPACINEPYTQSVTFNVPQTFTYSGTTVPVNSIQIALTGAVTGLPDGLNYSCDPPNCVFNANTLGCMLVSGTPTSNNTPGDKELTIEVTVYSFINIPLAFPGQVSPGQKYFITVKNPGECSVGTNDLSGQIVGIKNAPNPFGQFTSVIVEAITGGQYTFEVYNLLGKKVQDQIIQLTPGSNQFTFDAGELPNGTYFYALGNREGKISNAFVINR